MDANHVNGPHAGDVILAVSLELCKATGAKGHALPGCGNAAVPPLVLVILN
jgi:hypothetical protein